MTRAIVAQKVGMTQIFNAEGRAVPVTLLAAGPCCVVQVKTPESDGYSSIQVGFVERQETKTNRPLRGHFQKAGVSPRRYLKEFRVADAGRYRVGQEIKADIFAEGDRVDVTGISRGKGFAGSVKRHGYGRGPTTHGSHYHRGPGSMGAIDAARVFKGKKLPGRMGGKKRTVQNLEVVSVDADRHLLLVKGSIPGPRGAVLTVREAVKAKKT